MILAYGMNKSGDGCIPAYYCIAMYGLGGAIIVGRMAGSVGGCCLFFFSIFLIVLYSGTGGRNSVEPCCT